MRTSWPIVTGAWRPLARALVATFVLVGACSEPTGSSGGTLRLSVATTGVEPDPDGYLLSMDGGPPRAMPPNGEVVLTNVAAGSHRLEWSGVASNCSADGGPARDVTVEEGEVADAAFRFTCAASVGSLLVTIVTTGPAAPGSYAVSVDDATPASIAANGSRLFANVRRGTRIVTLMNLPANCSLQGSTRREIELAANSVTTVDFQIACTLPSGAVRVTVTSTGSPADPDGYRALLIRPDFYYPDTLVRLPIGTNATVTMPDVPIGSYEVQLDGVAAFCTLTPDVVPVTVVMSQTANVAFRVTCAPPGSLRVTTTTTGAEPDTDGYRLSIVGVGNPLIATIAANGSTTYPLLRAGSYEVILEDIAGNCSLTGAATRIVEVPSGGEASLAFALHCQARGSIRVTNATTGVDLDPDGYEVRVVLTDEQWSAALEVGGDVTVAGLNAGTYLLRLEGAAENCATVGSATREVQVVPGATVATSVDVTCAPAGLLAFASMRDGNQDVYVTRSNGTGLMRLTTHAGNDESPRWSPDGRRLAFVSDRAERGRPDLYLMNADGTGVVRRTLTGNNVSPAWSPDGRRIAFVSARDGREQVYVMSADEDGTTPTRLTNHAAMDFDPAWSPDGSRIAFASSRVAPMAIFVMQADGTNVRRLSPDIAGSAEAWRPTWSPDGRTLAFAALSCSWYYYCDGVLMLMNSDGSGARVLGPGEPMGISWSPDGRTIAYDTYRDVDSGGTTSILFARVDGSYEGLLRANGHSPSWRR